MNREAWKTELFQVCSSAALWLQDPFIWWIRAVFFLMVFPDYQPSHLAPRSRRVWEDPDTICINWCKWEVIPNVQSLCCCSRAGFGLHWVESWEVLTSDLFQHLWPHKNIIQCLPKHRLHAEYDVFQCMRIILLNAGAFMWKTEKEAVQAELSETSPMFVVKMCLDEPLKTCRCS